MKTGNVPPDDFVFDELQPGQEINGNTLKKVKRSTSKAELSVSTNNYQRKRELEKKVEAKEIELAKGNKVYQSFGCSATVKFIFSSKGDGSTSYDD